MTHKPLPIPFGTQTMPVNRLMYCAEVLRDVFRLMERDATHDVIVGHLEQVRDNMLKQWGPAE
jgi:hypothetical protein